MVVLDLDYGRGFPPARLAALMAEQMPSISAGGFPVAGQPLVLPARKYDELMDATTRLLRLHHKAVSRLAAGSQGRLAALKADRRAFPRFIADERFELQHAIDMARADVIITSGGPQFIEFNVGGGFAGMVQFEVLRRIWNQVGAASQEPRLIGDNPFASLASLITRTSAEHGTEPAALFLNCFDDSGRTLGELETQRRLLREYGIAADFADVRSIDPAEVLSRSPRPVCVVQLSEREAVDAGWDLTPLLQLVKAGMTAIPSQSARLVDSKKVTALLSEGQPWMSGPDHSLVQRFIPWTRIVRDQVVSWRGRVSHIQQLLTEEQSHFVLKGSAGLSGKEVIFGAGIPSREWAQLVASAIETEYYIAQEVVESVQVRVRVLRDADGTCDDTMAKMVVSPFSIANLPTGCHVRLDSTPGIGLVTRGTGAFPGCLLGGGQRG